MDSATSSTRGEYVATSADGMNPGSEARENQPLSEPRKDTDSGHPTGPLEKRPCSRITVPEIARRLDIGRLAVYAMLEQGIMPGIRLGRRWIITRQAYGQWESTCGMRRGAGLHAKQEVTVLN